MYKLVFHKTLLRDQFLFYRIERTATYSINSFRVRIIKVCILGNGFESCLLLNFIRSSSTYFYSLEIFETVNCTLQFIQILYACSSSIYFYNLEIFETVSCNLYFIFIKTRCKNARAFYYTCLFSNQVALVCLSTL